MSLRLARLVERITRSFGAKSPTCTVFFDVAEAFDTAWIDDLYKLTLLNFPPYIVHSISSYLRSRTFEVSFQRPRHLVAACGMGWLKVDCSPFVLFSLYVTLAPRRIGPLCGDTV